MWGKNINKELKKENDILQKKVASYQRLLSHSIDVIWMMDMRLKFTYISDSVYENFGYTADEWKGKRLSTLDKYKEFIRLFKLALQQIKNYKKKKHVVFQSEIKHKNGDTIFIEVATKIITNKYGIATGIMGNTRNITKRKIIEKQLIEANETQQKFFSIISHDLINPFNAILGYTDLLDKEFDNFKDAEKKEFISTINKYATHNYKLTKNLLEWSRTQQNSIIIKKEQVNIESTIMEVLNTYESLAKKKEIVTNVHFEDAYYIYADRNCLKTILNNIYCNAIKFSYNLGVIGIVVLNTNDITTIQVKDHGVGMNEEQVKNLFKINKTTSTLGTDNEKGTGFGLLICKELIDLHNGKIDVISKPGKGTTITLTL